MNTREIQACIRSVVKKEFETAGVDAGYDPSK
jgi:hypothetical protein